MLRRIGIIAVLSLIVAALTASVALAANPQFKQNRDPVARDLGNVLRVTGTLVGLGVEGAEIQLVAEGNVTVACVNPSGGNEPPGQQPAAPIPLASDVIQVDPEDISRSGQYNFTLFTNAPTQEQIDEVSTCKDSPGWSTRLVGVTFTQYQILVDGVPVEGQTFFGPFPGA
jgi:hypothetical protein